MPTSSGWSERSVVGEALPGLHVRRSGHAPGPDVETFVLLHSFGASSFTWHHWLPALERRERSCMPVA